MVGLGPTELCLAYSKGRPALLSIVTHEQFKPVSHNNDALILTQRVALVFCNSTTSHSGSYDCQASNSEKRISLIVNVFQPPSPVSEAGTIAVVCVLVFLVVVTSVCLVVACLKYRSVKNGPQLMWPEEPTSPLVVRDIHYPQPGRGEGTEEDEYEFPRENLQLGRVLGIV